MESIVKLYNFEEKVGKIFPDESSNFTLDIKNKLMINDIVKFAKGYQLAYMRALTNNIE